MGRIWHLALLFWISVCIGKQVEVEFTPQRGWFTGPVTVALTNPQGFDKIQYAVITSDTGSAPLTITTGTTYTTPISITQHCILQALGWNSTTRATTNQTQHSYFFASNVITQPLMQTSITSVARFSSVIPEALTNIPSFSFRSTIKYSALSETEVVTSIDYIPAPSENKTGWSWGSANTYETGHASLNYAKHSIRFEFNGGNLNYPLFRGFDGGTSMEGVRWDHLSLRSHSQDSVFSSTYKQYGVKATYTKNIWHDWTTDNFGHYSAKARAVHVFWNSQYQGVYHLRQTVGSGDMSRWYGSGSGNFTTIAAGPKVKSGNLQTWMNIVNTKTWETIAPWINAGALIDFMLIFHYSANYLDSSNNYNWQTVGPNLPAPFLGPYAGWSFVHSDDDFSFIPNQQKTGIDGGVIGGIWDNYKSSPDYQLRTSDRFYAHYMKTGGFLTDSYVLAQFEKIRTTFKYDTTLVAESARWAASWTDSPNTGKWNIDNWLTDFTNQKTQFVTGRNAIVTAAYRTAFPTMFSQMIANVPKFNLENNVVVAPGTQLTITGNAGCTLYYTNDGTDPRVPISGATAAGAINVGSNTVTLTLQTTTQIRARCKMGAAWATLDEVFVKVKTTTCVLCGKVVISEIFYRPKDPKGSTPKMVHFVEIQNVGTTPVDLTGSYLKPISFTFPPVVLAPGAFYVASRSVEEFKNQYGRFPDGMFFGVLDDKSKSTVALYDSVGNKVFSANYSTSIPYSELADGVGWSLVPRNGTYGLLNKPDSAKSWRTSSKLGGSPGAEDPAPPASRVVTLLINEISTSLPNTTAEWVEVYNPTATPVNLYRWKLANGYKNPGQDFRIKTALTVPANGYLVITSDQSGFRWSNKGEDVVLFAAECCDLDGVTPVINGEWIEETFDESLPGLTYGRFKLSTGEWKFIQLQTPSSGAVNSGPYIPPVVISGVGFQTPSGTYANMQYIKLTCVSKSPVSIQGWTLGVGSKSLQAPYVFGAITLQPGQNLYLINSTATVAAFKTAFGLSYLDPTALVLGSFNASTLRDKITLRQAVPGESFTVNVDGVPVQDFAFLLTGKKRQVNPVPPQLTRIVSPAIGYAGDPASWNRTQPPAPFPPVNCTLTPWTPFSSCTVSCAGGTQTRTRNITAPAKYGGTCENTTETVPCNSQPCPINCKWNEWEAWTSCTLSCGNGKQTRARSVNISAMFGGVPCTGNGTESLPCNTQPCPVDCVGGWGTWPACDCSTSKQTRTFFVSIPAQYGGIPCNFTDGQTDTKGCVVASCSPVACVGDWLPWETCSCTSNTQIRRYNISISSANGGAACSEINGATQSQTCTPTNCPTDCVGTWTVWPACDCASKTQTRFYQVSIPVQNGGVPCPVVDDTNQTEACVPITCSPVMCVGDWSSWTSCRCDTNATTRTYTISVPAANGGAPCSVTDQSVDVKACTCKPIDCVGGYSDFSDCNCSTNQQTRAYIITTPSQYGGAPCPFFNKTTDTKTCACGAPVDCEGEFGDWEECDCLTNTTTRTFTITKQPQGTGKPCPTEQTETKPCNCGAESGGLPGWGIALIVLGALFVVLVLLGALYYTHIAASSQAMEVDSRYEVL